MKHWPLCIIVGLTVVVVVVVAVVVLFAVALLFQCVKIGDREIKKTVRGSTVSVDSLLQYSFELNKK